MNSHTKQILFIALGLFCIATATFVFMYLQINKLGEKLSIYTTAITENNTLEEKYIKINRIVQETADDRVNLDRAFFSDESESISFLGDIENLARSIGLDLKTDNLDKVKDNESGLESITMTFSYTGQKNQVMNFTRLLEEIPYHSKITSLSLQQNPNDSWTGNLTILISIKPS